MNLTVEEANNYIRQFLSFREEGNQQQVASMFTSEKGRNYYEAQDVSFIFSKEAIFNLCMAEDVNAIRIYLGADPETGNPTLVVVPCALSEDESIVTNKISNLQSSVEQHPKTRSGQGSSLSFNLLEDNDSI